jgi:hypothetical protein
VRTDRTPLGPRSEALSNPNFSGAWSTAILSSAPPTGSDALPPTPSLGSGWGDRISIAHDHEHIDVERVIFVPREGQPLVRYRYALDGSKSKNPVHMGRTGPAPTSTAGWDGDRLVITTQVPFQHPDDGQWIKQKIVRTMWLQPPTESPWEPALVVETERSAALHGMPSTNRTVYRRGYR